MTIIIVTIAIAPRLSRILTMTAKRSKRNKGYVTSVGSKDLILRTQPAPHLRKTNLNWIFYDSNLFSINSSIRSTKYLYLLMNV